MTMKAIKTRSLVLHWPEVFEDQDFVSWLNNASPKATWHRTGTPGEFSDVFVLVDSSLNGEGSDSDMPEHVWNAIVDQCRNAFHSAANDYHIVVRLSPV